MEVDEPITSGGADYDEFDLDDDFEQLDTEDVAADEATIQGIQKLRKLFEQHPECRIDYIESVVPKINIAPETAESGPSRQELDANHKTFPFLTVYERTAIIGLRAEVLSRGGQPFIPVPSYVSDVREIARLELEQKRLPYIVKRPLPNGTYEYWRLSDLMII